ncbi:hypothetical protein G4177_19950 [Corallococcus sp. ZKHCc1 1396]|uniref:Lipoprotein n=1 Tax=Corallococcus soli TaxID=2710757 RepID=A0ABR9PRB1_9BACT|nr:hypothetical protein [Corallococcus soli]MBE4750445.1 hypothetical protein [Corallococcus soli]
MNVRSLLLSAVLVFGSVACSKPPSSTTPSSGDESGAAASADLKPTDGTPTPASPTGNEPGTAAPTPTPGDATMSATYIVKDNGKRCFAPPCDHYDVFLADKPDEKLKSIHEVDLSAVTGGDDAKQGELMKRAFTPAGLKLEGSLTEGPNAVRNIKLDTLRATRVID